MLVKLKEINKGAIIKKIKSKNTRKRKKGVQKVDKDDKKNNLGLNPRLRRWLRSTRRVYHTSTPLLNVFPLFDIRLTHCKEHTHSILLALQML